MIGDSVVNTPPTNAGDAGDTSSTPGLGRSLEEEMATHSSMCKVALLSIKPKSFSQKSHIKAMFKNKKMNKIPMSLTLF